MRLDQRAQASPRKYGVHLGQEPHSSRHVFLFHPHDRSERPLLIHHHTSRLPPIDCLTIRKIE
jgi:hypothetical protein